MKVVCCDDHVELALDVVVDETGSFPVLGQIENEADKLSTDCEYCNKNATYIVSN